MRTPQHMNRIVGAGFALLLLLTSSQAVAEPPSELLPGAGAEPSPASTPAPMPVMDAASTHPEVAPVPAPAPAPILVPAPVLIPQPQTSRVHLSLNGSGGFQLDSSKKAAIQGVEGRSVSIGGGGLSVESDVFFRPLVDDGCPRDQQGSHDGHPLCELSHAVLRLVDRLERQVPERR